MNTDLFKKLVEERPLTAEEALALDEVLEGDASEQVARLVGAQHEAAPSLAWRSKLNEKLSQATTKKRRTLVWGLGTAVTTGAVALMFLLAVFNKPIVSDSPSTDTPLAVNDSFEDALLSEHQDSMTQASLGVYASFEEGSGF